MPNDIRAAQPVDIDISFVHKAEFITVINDSQPDPCRSCCDAQQFFTFLKGPLLLLPGLDIATDANKSRDVTCFVPDRSFEDHPPFQVSVAIRNQFFTVSDRYPLLKNLNILVMVNGCDVW